MATTTNVTGLIEHLEALEERLGITLTGISAFETIDDDLIYVMIRGEIQSKGSASLEYDLEVVGAVYGEDGTVIGRSDVWVSAEEFYGVDTFEIEVDLPVSVVTKVRVYPKAQS